MTARPSPFSPQAIAARIRSQGPAILTVAGWLGLVLFAAIASQEIWNGIITPRTPLLDIRPSTGQAYTATLPGYLVSPDGQPSRAIVYEDGKPLSISTIDLPSIATYGNGRFCPSGRTLYFSTPDNTDPTTNARHYEVAGPLQVPAGYVALCVLLFAAGLAAPSLKGAEDNGIGIRRASSLRLAAVLVLIGLGIGARQVLPSAPFAWPDSWSYSLASLSTSAGGSFQLSFRELFYQVWIYAGMKLLPSAAALAVVQHAVGLAGALFLFLAIREASKTLESAGQRTAAILCDLIALGSMAGWALSNLSLYYEHYLMPEALFPAVCAAAIYCSAKLISGDGKGPWALRWAALASFAVLLLYSIIPRWGLGAGLAVLPLAYALHGGQRSLRRKAMLFCLPFVAFAAIVLLPDRLLRMKDHPHGDVFLDMHLFCVQARIMKRELDHEATKPKPAYPPSLLRLLSNDIDAELARFASPGHDQGSTPSLGFDADKLMYANGSVLDHASAAFGGDPRRIREFFMYFYVKAWLHQPRAMAGKITDQMLRPFRAPAQLFDTTGFTFNTREELYGTRSVMVAEVAKAHAGGSWAGIERLTSQGEQDPRVVTTPDFIVRLHKACARLFLPGLALVGALCIAGCFFPPCLRGPMPWMPWAVLALASYTGIALNCLTVGIIHTLDQTRYVHNQTLLALFAVSASAVAGLLCVCSWRARGGLGQEAGGTKPLHRTDG